MLYQDPLSFSLATLYLSYFPMLSLLKGANRFNIPSELFARFSNGNAFLKRVAGERDKESGEKTRSVAKKVINVGGFVFIKHAWLSGKEGGSWWGLWRQDRSKSGVPSVSSVHRLEAEYCRSLKSSIWNTPKLRSNQVDYKD
jgi:hypothetical protein